VTRARDVASNGGLVLIGSTTVGSAVSSIVISNAFSATYDNYKIVVSGGLNLRLGATTTGYYYAGTNVNYSAGTVTGDNAQNAASWVLVARTSTNSINGNIELFSPNLAKTTHAQYANSRSATDGNMNSFTGYLANTTQYTAFTLTVVSGTITGGTIKVYGYK
jgi:hypothetical protein